MPASNPLAQRARPHESAGGDHSVPLPTDLRAAQVGEGIREFTTLDRNPLLGNCLNLWSCIPRQAPIRLELMDAETPVLGQMPADLETLS
jgi:DsbC/DsbD-like thiol-disulfide interchange protein